MRHSEELDRLRESRRLEVTHERIRVMTAMTEKCSRRFKNIQDRESRRDEFEDARCMLDQARGMRDCLEGLKDSGKDIPQETINMYVDLEKYYDGKTTRLEVGAIPESDLTLSPLVLESRFVIKEILDKVDKHGSNLDLIDSEAARALRSPRDGFTKDLLDMVESPARPDAPALFQETAPAPYESAIEPTVKMPDASTHVNVVALSDPSSFGTSDPDTSGGRSEANREIRLVPSQGKGQDANADPPAKPFGSISDSDIPEKKDPPALG